MIAAGGVGGAVLAGVALVDWHYALRYVGVLGTQLTLFNWLTSYDSPQVALHSTLFFFQSSYMHRDAGWPGIRQITCRHNAFWSIQVCLLPVCGFANVQNVVLQVHDLLASAACWPA